ncbi:MAG: DUF502 domain-containing protein [Phycisphaerae bacterium]|nr:DUF502 domain-containing protein [Phycisphaerae bacterium]
MVKRIIGYFLKGLLVFVPAALTVFVAVWAVTKLDALLRDLLKVDVPGQGIAITVLGIIAIGFLASHWVGRWFFSLLDSVFTRVPLLKLVYGSVRDFIAAFAGERKSFDKPVAAELAAGGPKVMGFVTREDLACLGLPGEVSVYLPQSYNFAGQLLIFPSERVRPLSVDSSAAMAFIVSGGVAGPA